MSDRTVKRRGFTLLEMLAATAMVAMLAGSLYASLHIAFQARHSALAAVETVRRSSLSMELIQADLESAMVPSGILAGEFVGRSAQNAGAAGDELSFYAAAMDIEPGPGVGDVKKVEYCCEPSWDSGEMVLIRRLTTNLLAPTTPEPKQETICRRLRTFTLKYFDGSTWQDNWDSAAQNNQLPQAVEVTLEWAGASGDADQKISRVMPIPCGQGAEAASSTGAAP